MILEAHGVKINSAYSNDFWINVHTWILQKKYDIAD